MYSGIAGMKASNEQLNVISNNIANSQTTAFNSSDVTFEDMYNQTVQAASSPTSNVGGTNASQVGTGTKVESINRDMSAGSNMTTNSALDNCISGNGFFVLAQGTTTGSTAGTISVDSAGTATAAAAVNGVTSAHGVSTPSNIQLNYSRDGSFSLDSNGNIVNSSGDKLMGYALTNTAPTADSTTQATGDSIVVSTTDGTPNTVNFVDSTSSTLYADDSSLVALEIPSTVMEGTTAEKVSSYSIASTGIITATLADGKKAAIGQIALASFSNDAGLNATGSNMYDESTNSGTATLNTGINTTGADNSGAYGTILSDTLQASNVDLATEFTHMIEASRAFEANGKIITTGDTILQTIIGLKQ